jgi:hypothetical protein
MRGLGRLYVVEFHNVAVAAQQDFFYIKPAADKICLIEEVKVAVVGGTADAGDAQEELLSVETVRLPATVTVGSGGTAFTPVPTMVNDSAAGFTARINDTTKATTSGTAANLDSDGMNNRNPYLYIPAPEHALIIANAQALCCRLNTTPADSLTCNGRALVRELP